MDTYAVGLNIISLNRKIIEKYRRTKELSIFCATENMIKNCLNINSLLL